MKIVLTGSLGHIGTSLARSINSYDYFGYSVHEALFLSPKEEATITEIIENIEQECRTNIDSFSHAIIIAQVELLLTYSERFYHRQFMTRRISSHRILGRLERLLSDYYGSDTPRREVFSRCRGSPTISVSRPTTSAPCCAP